MQRYEIDFDAVVAGLRPSDLAGCGDEDIMRWVDATVGNAIEAELAALNTRLEKLAFPLMSGSVNKIFESPEEYFEAEAAEIREQLEAEREPLFRFLKQWLFGDEEEK